MKYFYVFITVIIALILHTYIKTTELSCQNNEQQEVETEYITVLVEREEMGFQNYLGVCLDIDCHLQNPELPTGCEVTSLANVLRYLGYDIDKLTLADTYLPKGEIGKTHPNDAFIGNPRSESSYGAYAPVIVETANNYFASIEAKHGVYNVSNTELHDLLKYVNDGYPVIIWATMNMEEGYYSTKWNLDNGEFQWYAKEHCLALVGYTKEGYIFADPLVGLTIYDKEVVEWRYDELGKQAVVIY